MNKPTNKKSQKRFLKRFLFLILVLIIIAVVFYDKLPIKTAAEGQIVKALEAQGLKVNSFEVKSLGNSAANFAAINIGEDRLLEVKDVKVAYDIRKVVDKQVKNIVISDVNLNIYQQDGMLLIGGLEPLMKKPAGPAKTDNIIYSAPGLKKFLSDKIELSALNISALIGNMDFKGSIDGSLNMQPQTKLQLLGKDWVMLMKPYNVSVGGVAANAALDEKKKEWHGESILQNIIITGLPSEMPPLELKSEFAFSEKDFSVNVEIYDAKKTTSAKLRLGNNKLKIDYARIPWGGGRISADNVLLPLGGKTPVSFEIKVDKVELSSIFGLLSEGKITGQGQLSGKFPIIYYPDGRILINDGGAAAIENGIINVSESLLQGDNPQLQMTRELLQNFHYTKLKILVSSKQVDKKDKTVVSLVLEGNNPDALEGKKVNFSINITGDVLPLLQQSILPFNDIKQLMKMKDK